MRNARCAKAKRGELIAKCGIIIKILFIFYNPNSEFRIIMNP